jgi:hypothetical protein
VRRADLRACVIEMVDHLIGIQIVERHGSLPINVRPMSGRHRAALLTASTGEGRTALHSDFWTTTGCGLFKTDLGKSRRNAKWRAG